MRPPAYHGWTGAKPYNCYGQSEIAPLATVLRPEEHDARPASCGRPVLNVETRIVDDAMRDVAPGERGGLRPFLDWPLQDLRA